MILVTWDACVFTAADIDKIVAFQFDFDPVLLMHNARISSDRTSENEKVKVGSEFKWIKIVPLQWI